MSFTFIDLFAGIGGFRLALESLGGTCVFSSEWDPQAQKTYAANFGDTPNGDITQVNEKLVPDHDILTAGFPCQAFSIAGRKKGFDDIRGTLFFDVARIIKAKRPKAIFLENVKGLRMHDKGRTLQVILDVLRNDLGYTVPEPQIVNARNFGVPQNRERLYIVGFRSDIDASKFEYPTPTDQTKTLADILEKGPVSTKYFMSETYLNTLRLHRERHQAKGNGFGFEIKSPDDVASAIVVGGMGRERNLVVDHNIPDRTPVTRIKGVIAEDNIRRMTPREWARLQGFPDTYVIPVADASAYKQFGNSVAVPAIRATAERILTVI